MKKKITIEAEGKSANALQDAISEALRSIERGNLAGFDSNNEGSYSFDVQEEK